MIIYIENKGIESEKPISGEEKTIAGMLGRD